MKSTKVSLIRVMENGRSRILFPVLVLSLVLAACAPTPTPGPTPGGGDARAAVLQAIQAHLTAGPYRVVASTTAGENTVAIRGEVVLPDKFHLFSSVSGGPEREYIIIGSATYAKVNGAWTPVQLDLSGLISEFIDRLDPTAISDVLLVGPNSVNGTPALAYTYTYAKTVNGAMITNHDEIWVGTSGGLPLKQVVDGEVSGTAYHSEQTIVYDSSITIVAPV